MRVFVNYKKDDLGLKIENVHTLAKPREIATYVGLTTSHISRYLYDSLPSSKESRKEFAVWVNEKCSPWAPYLFKRYDGQDYNYLMYKKEFGLTDVIEVTK